MWDVASRRPVGPRLQHAASVQAVAAFPDGLICVSGSFDGTARVWRVPTEVQGEPGRITLWCEVLTGCQRLGPRPGRHIVEQSQTGFGVVQTRVTLLDAI
jgi:WD40 repeat protein